MSDTKPIPIRFDEATLASIRRVAERTDLAQSDVIRRALEFALETIAKTGRVDFLMDREARALNIAQMTAFSSTLAEPASEYHARPSAKPRRGAA